MFQNPSFNCKINGRIRRKSRGAILIEVAFTLPIVVYLIFFCIELIKINITQDALQSICEEITYLTIAHDYTSGADLIKKGDAVIEKYRPSFIPKTAPGYSSANYPVIRWTYETYFDLDDMLGSVPYGGSSVLYPLVESDTPAQYHVSQAYYNGRSQYVPVLGMEYNAKTQWRDSLSCMSGDGLPNNRVFVLTVTCNYPFSSGMVKTLFSDGINTKIAGGDGGYSGSSSGHKKGTMYLLYARGAGIVNPK